jgi:hypothetical protein
MDFSDLMKIAIAALAYAAVLVLGILTVRWMGRRGRNSGGQHD